MTTLYKMYDSAYAPTIRPNVLPNLWCGYDPSPFALHPWSAADFARVQSWGVPTPHIYVYGLSKGLEQIPTSEIHAVRLFIDDETQVPAELLAWGKNNNCPIYASFSHINFTSAGHGPLWIADYDDIPANNISVGQLIAKQYRGNVSGLADVTVDLSVVFDISYFLPNGAALPPTSSLPGDPMTVQELEGIAQLFYKSACGREPSPTDQIDFATKVNNDNVGTVLTNLYALPAVMARQALINAIAPPC